MRIYLAEATPRTDLAFALVCFGVAKAVYVS